MSLCKHCSQARGCETLLIGTAEQTDFGIIVQSDGNSGNGLARWPRHTAVPAGPKAVGDTEPSHGQLCGAKASPCKESWLPHTTGPATKDCPRPLVAASHLKALRLGTAYSLKEAQVCLFLGMFIHQILEKDCKSWGHKIRQAKAQCDLSTALFSEGPRSLCSCWCHGTPSVLCSVPEPWLHQHEVVRTPQLCGRQCQASFRAFHVFHFSTVSPSRCHYLQVTRKASQHPPWVLSAILSSMCKGTASPLCKGCHGATKVSQGWVQWDVHQGLYLQAHYCFSVEYVCQGTDYSVPF